LRLPIPPTSLHQRHLGKLREVTDEDRHLGPERQVVYGQRWGSFRLKTWLFATQQPKPETPCPSDPSIIQLPPFLTIREPLSALRV
jgi:hypothetical protein